MINFAQNNTFFALIKEQQSKLCFQRTIHGHLEGDYGGLDESTVYDLCELLNPRRPGGTNWIDLAEKLFNIDQLTIDQAKRKINPTKDIFTAYFSLCTNLNKSNKVAVRELRDALESIGIEEGVGILERSSHI